MLQLNDASCALGVKLLLESCAEFAQTDAAAACPRLQRRKGSILPMSPLAFTVLSHEHYVTSEGGALLTSTEYPAARPALCRERVMNSGQSCAEVTVVHADIMTIGVGRPMLDPNADYDDAAHAYNTADFWGVYSGDGTRFHNNGAQDWPGQQGYATGDVLQLLLDSDAGTLTVKKNGTLLGMAVTSGLTGDLCWAVCCWEAGESVRIKAVDPAEF
jgi:hypothetical protein